MIGIIKENLSIGDKYSYLTLAERLIAKREAEKISTPIYYILVLNSSPPYMKWGNLSDEDLKLKYDSKDELYWINLYEPNKLIIALESVKFVYYDDKGVFSI